jgi:hypothetical protein
VKSIHPSSHVACPSKGFFPFDKHKGNGDLLYWGVKSGDSGVGSEISQQLFHKVRGFGPVSTEDLR